MGETTYVRKNTQTKPIKKPKLFLNIDLTMVVVVVLLLLLGLLMVYSSSWGFGIWSDNPKPTHYMLGRQIRWVLLGSVLAIAVSYFDYHKIRKYLLPMMATVVLLLLAVFIFGDERFNAQRTLFNGSIQPSELAKLTIIIYLSFWLFSKKDQLNKILFGLVPLGMIIGIFAILILFQPDLSAAITIVMLGGLLFFLADGELRQIIIVALVALIFILLAVTLFKTGQNRLIQYLDGLKDPVNSSYHVKLSMEAMINGGLFGVGIGKGTTKFLGLPVPWTDSIFAVIAEELGLIGAAVVICLFVLFLWRGIHIAQHAPDQLGKLLAGGITFWIIIEALINMGVLVNIFPFAGNALPLVSAGGSNLVTTLAAVGILLNVSRQSTRHKKSEGRIPGASINMRRGDRRRRVSRSNRPSSRKE
ncbi:MAG: FtsW/RodA/SpoVE family cell cycle protein [Anaerolineaceae bacterium]|nr:FtsW/RodA/SpoVE family cell cycle protein [Anaerolineaceae bacterium]